MRRSICIIALAVLAAACGGGGGGDGSEETTTPPAETPSADTVVHAKGSALVPAATELSEGFKVSNKAYEQRTDPDVLSDYFGESTAAVSKQLTSAAEGEFTGTNGSTLTFHVFVFPTEEAAMAAWDVFSASRALDQVNSAPAGAPGEDVAVSSETYGANDENISYRYTLREANVLAYVNLDVTQGSGYTFDEAQAAAEALVAEIDQAAA